MPWQKHHTSANNIIIPCISVPLDDSLYGPTWVNQLNLSHFQILPMFTVQEPNMM